MSLLRHERLRKSVSGTAERARLAVFRSNRHIYVQIIDDEKAHTLAAANTLQKDMAGLIEGKKGVEIAAAVGKAIAEKALAAGMKQVVFDRGGFKYHGQIKALAESAREAGLEF